MTQIQRYHKVSERRFTMTHKERLDSPWYDMYAGQTTGGRPVVEVQTLHGHRISIPYGTHPDPAFVARLVATAPDMLSAIKDVLNCMTASGPVVVPMKKLLRLMNLVGQVERGVNGQESQETPVRA